MRSLKLLLTVPEKGTADGEFQVTPDGGQAGQLPPYLSKLPFCDPERRRTLLKALGAVEFRLKDFQTEELDWMVEVGLVTEERSDFHNDIQKVIGQAIYESLFPEERKEARQLLQRALAQAGAREQLHIEIEFSQYVERRGRLPDYPWELAHDGDQFLARKQVVFSRFIAFLENTPNLPPVEKINVLLVSSTAYDRSLGLKPLLPSESNAIYEALTTTEQDQETDKKISVTRLESPTFKDFGDYLTENRREKAPHIIHFDGHGFFGKRCDYCRTMHKKVSARECRECGKSLQDKSFQGYLLFEPDEDCKQNADYVSAQEIAEQLQKVSLEQSEAHGLRLVVMSACKTGMALGSNSVFNGVAQRLIQHQVPAVVAMQYNVTVGGAKAFSERFYRAICNKFPITQAVSLGQTAMREGNQWYRPVLYLRWHDNEGGQLFAHKEPVLESSLSRGQVLQNTVVIERQVPFNKLSLAQRLEKEKLEKDLAARQKDYEGVADKLRWETEPIEQNSLQAKLDKLTNEIKWIEQELKKLKTSSQAEIITILKPYFDREKVQIQKAYKLSLPERLIDDELPQSLEALISSLQLPQQEENYSFLEKFVGNLLLNQNLSHELKQELKELAEENIKNCQQLLSQLRQERHQREQQCNPGLLVAISERKGSYCVEAWLIKNIAQYEQYSSSDCEQITINKQAEIPTNDTLNDVPELLKQLINKSFEKCQNYLKQIHIFLPSKLMNYAVDCWQNWQDEEEEDEEEEDDDDYTTTIGEDYEVLLRCSERLRGKSPPVIKWREKGKKLKSELTQAAEQIFVLGNSNNPKTLFKQLKDDKDDGALAVKITTVFQQKEPGTLLWKAAVPLALWIRQQLPNTKNQSVLDELLKDSRLEELPTKVKSKRIDAFDYEPPENHVGRHLCLLWDDPDLLPPEQLLTENNL